MAPPQKLKMFRTTIGFHDAYVAAPRKRAALTAGDAPTALLAIGSAEQVSSPKLMAATLSIPAKSSAGAEGRGRSISGLRPVASEPPRRAGGRCGKTIPRAKNPSRIGAHGPELKCATWTDIAFTSRVPGNPRPQAAAGIVVLCIFDRIGNCPTFRAVVHVGEMRTQGDHEKCP